MRDRVNLEQAAATRQGTHKQWLRPPAILGLGALLIINLPTLLAKLASLEPVRLACLTGNQWQVIEGLPGAPESVQVSPGGVVWVATTLLGSLLCTAIFLLLTRLPFWWVDNALRRADYPVALRRAQFLRRLWPGSAAFLFIEGTVLLFAGRHEEAEQRLRESLAREQRLAGLKQSVCLGNLAEALMGQGRYREALQAYEGAQQIRPDRGSPYIGLAEVYLRQGIEPERALALAEQALACKQRTRWTRNVDRYMLGQMWADKAWALALLGRHAAAEEALDKAFAETDIKFLPMLAGLHYRVGQIMLLRGERTGAAERFARARRIDPVGDYGQLAAQALAALGIENQDQ